MARVHCQWIPLGTAYSPLRMAGFSICSDADDAKQENQ